MQIYVSIIYLKILWWLMRISFLEEAVDRQASKYYYVDYLTGVPVPFPVQRAQ